MKPLRAITMNAASSDSGNGSVPGTRLSSAESGSRGSGALAADGDSVGEFSLWRWVTAALECMTNEAKELHDVSRELAALWKARHAD